MGIKITLPLLLLLSILLVSLSPKPVAEGGVERLSHAEPLFFRALSNISHSLLCDVFWLLSTESGELSLQDGGLEASVSVGEIITVMDPFFSPAVHYYATYLASVHNAPRQGAAIYTKAGWFRPDDFQLVFNEMILRLTYEEPLDEDRVVGLAKRAMGMEEKRRFLGDVEYAEMVEGMMHFAASRRQRTEKKREDLIWLLEHSSSRERKAEITRELALIK